MNYQALQSRLDFVVYGKDNWRLDLKINQDGSPNITYDAHGLTVQEARRTIRNLINIARTPVHLNVIHGFNHGTGIKDMLAQETFSGRLISRFCPESNPGKTFMTIAA